MLNYSFETLSPIDFEELARDLLQANYNKIFETFRSGRDRGIDIRYSKQSNDLQLIIAQCKNYANSDWSNIQSVVKQEIGKVKKINPDKYIFITSFDLSVDQKQFIFDAFKPYIQEKSDILGKKDINNLLGLFPKIERKNFKLWLSSTNQIANIVNQSVILQSEFEEEEIKKVIKHFVLYNEYNEILEMLDKNHCSIITGDPGIGKTITSRFIIFQYLANGYSLINCSNDISEGYQLFNPDPNEKQIFFYDDFLGQTALAELSKNEDSNLLRFLKKIQQTENKRFLLTSRRYIFQNAIHKYEKLATSNFTQHEFLIDIHKIKKQHKARILYNHVFFSEIDANFKKEITKNNNFLKIINHKNYNPRLIDIVTTNEFVTQHYSREQSFFDFILDNLNFPKNIWEKSFTNHLSQLSQLILYHLALYRNGCSREAILNSIENNFPTLFFTESEFDQSIDMMEKTFITYNYDNKNSSTIRFYSPGVRDYIEEKLFHEIRILAKMFHNSDIDKRLFLLSSQKYHNLLQKQKRILDLVLNFEIDPNDNQHINFSASAIKNSYPDHNWVNHSLNVFWQNIDNLSFSDDFIHTLTLIKKNYPGVLESFNTSTIFTKNLTFLQKHEKNHTLVDKPVETLSYIKRCCDLIHHQIIDDIQINQKSMMKNIFLKYISDFSATYSPKHIEIDHHFFIKIPEEDDIRHCGDILAINTSNILSLIRHLGSQLQFTLENTIDKYPYDQESLFESDKDIIDMFASLDM